MSRIVLVTARDDLARRVHHAADGDLQLLPADPLPADPTQLRAFGVMEQPEVLILGPDVAPEQALDLAARFDQSCPGTSVVLVSDAGADVWLAAMRAGVRDVLLPDAEIPDVRLVLERARHAALGRRRGVDPAADSGRGDGHVIVVASPKGGCGKTTVASNLAVGLAAAGPQSTVLVDLDVQFGDIASALQLVPERCLTDAVSGPASQDTMVLKTFLTAHPTGLHALCGSDSPAAGDQITGAQVSALLKQLTVEFQYVVVDTAPGLSEHTLAALEAATDVVLLCGMDVPGVRGMRKELQLLHELNLTQLNRHVVLNFAERRGGLTVADVQHTLGVSADVVLPRSKAVPLSTNQGVPLLQSGVRDPATKELRRLVDRFTPAPDTPQGTRRSRHRATATVGEAT